MSTASSLTIDEMPSPIKPREDHHTTLSSPEQVHTPRLPPSPLETEIDSKPILVCHAERIMGLIEKVIDDDVNYPKDNFTKSLKKLKPQETNLSCS